MASKPVVASALSIANSQIESLTSEKQELASQNEGLSAENFALKAEIEAHEAILKLHSTEKEELKARLARAEEIFRQQRAEIEELRSKIPAPRAPKPPTFNPTEVTWEGVSRNGKPCRRIGKGNTSWLEDFENGQWIKRGTRRATPPPMTDEEVAQYMRA